MNSVRVNETSGHNDTIEAFRVPSTNEDYAFAVSDLLVRGVRSRPRDCDDHPSCDCYSQCHIVVW